MKLKNVRIIYAVVFSVRISKLDEECGKSGFAEELNGY